MRLINTGTTLNYVNFFIFEICGRNLLQFTYQSFQVSQYEKTVMDAIKKLEEKLDEEEETETPEDKVAEEKLSWIDRAKNIFSNLVWRVCYIVFFPKMDKFGKFPISF